MDLDYIQNHCNSTFLSIPSLKQYIGTVDATFLINNINIPDIQREIDESWVENLYNLQIEHHKLYKCYSFNLLEIVLFNDTLNIINGQHRLCVIKKLVEKHNENFYVFCMIYKVETQEELETAWTNSNSGKPVKPVINTNTQKDMNLVRKYLNDNYPKYISKNERTNIPHISINKISQDLENCKIFEKMSGQWVCQKISQINEKLMYLNMQSMKEICDNIYFDKCRQKCPEKPLFIGIYRNNEWVYLIKEMIDNDNNVIKLPPSNSMRRKTIPQRLRTQVWKKRNPISTSGKCYVCNEDITYDDFNCGHIISVHHGGGTILSNLEPICGSCNRDMNIMNLNDYKNMYYPSCD